MVKKFAINFAAGSHFSLVLIFDEKIDIIKLFP